MPVPYPPSATHPLPTYERLAQAAPFLLQQLVAYAGACQYCHGIGQARYDADAHRWVHCPVCRSTRAVIAAALGWEPERSPLGLREAEDAAYALGAAATPEDLPDALAQLAYDEPSLADRLNDMYVLPRRGT